MSLYPESLQRKIDHAALMLISGTIRGQLWLGFSSCCAYVVHLKGGDADDVINTLMLSGLLSMGFFYARWLKEIYRYYLFNPRFANLTFFKRLSGSLLIFGFLADRRCRFVRCFDIGQHWLACCEKAFHDQEFETFKQTIEQERIALDREIKIKRAELAKVTSWTSEQRQRQYQRTMKRVAQNLRTVIYQLNGDSLTMKDDRLSDVFHHHQHAIAHHRELIETAYAEQMLPIQDGKKLAMISPHQQSIEGKLLYLAALIRAESDNHYDRLDFKRSDFDSQRYVYIAARKGINLDHWDKHLPAINAYLGGQWMVEPLDGTSLILSQLKELPPLIPFKEEVLRKDQLFYGINVRSGEPYYNPIETLPHHLVVGQSGSGKSVFLKQTLASVLFNIEAFEKVYLVDLKGGVELAQYAALHERFELVDDYDQLPAIAAEIYQTMRQRLSYMRDKGETVYPDRHILFVVDEYAQINQFEPITRDEKFNHKQLLSHLNRISMLGRAAKVTIWAQLQKATIDNISASFRNNLQSKICFKVHSNYDAAIVFGSTEDLPGVTSLGGFQNLAKGRFIFSDDVSGNAAYLQATMMENPFRQANI